ncbi:hypothetical protein CGLO_18232 [Colletotrichum gloeosporioides Cg-14]|uniref:Uncharacterized protein n=1 Tax=Colletotrichum gloeosporioides (strain Cg-14) TaxID=1237896 RepID=T0JIE5_COLGC|nr:hypothetical protein CGLO_18232 [Colletotrichum gloeosporioides Cg-14]
MLLRRLHGTIFSKSEQPNWRMSINKRSSFHACMRMTRRQAV